MNTVGSISLFQSKDDADKLIAHVYVKNLDDDDLDEVYLYIDEVYRKYKSISSGSVGDYGEYEFDELKDNPFLIYNEIAKYGKVVYETQLWELYFNPIIAYLRLISAPFSLIFPQS